MFIVALEAIDDDDHPALREEMLETIERYYEEERNGIAMKYRLVTATVE